MTGYWASNLGDEGWQDGIGMSYASVFGVVGKGE